MNKKYFAIKPTDRINDIICGLTTKNRPRTKEELDDTLDAILKYLDEVHDLSRRLHK